MCTYILWPGVQTGNITKGKPNHNSDLTAIFDKDMFATMAVKDCP